MSRRQGEGREKARAEEKCARRTRAVNRRTVLVKCVHRPTDTGKPIRARACWNRCPAEQGMLKGRPITGFVGTTVQEQTRRSLYHRKDDSLAYRHVRGRGCEKVTCRTPLFCSLTFSFSRAVVPSFSLFLSFSSLLAIHPLSRHTGYGWITAQERLMRHIPMPHHT
jgi:hypothetical protein